MIAFMDLEFNCDSDLSSKRTDYSLIEVAIVVMDAKSVLNINTAEVVDIYHCYIKPLKNGGKLYSKIVELTGITQDVVDNGKDAVEVTDDIYKLLTNYGVKKVYTYGGIDKHALIWERNRISSKVKASRSRDGFTKMVNILYDLADWSVISELSNKIRAIDAIGLAQWLSIFNINKSGVSHNALDDTNNLIKLVKVMRKFQVTNDMSLLNMDIIEQLLIFQKHRKVYNDLKKAYIDAKEYDLDVLFEMIKRNEKFPKFDDYLLNKDLYKGTE